MGCLSQSPAFLLEVGGVYTLSRPVITQYRLTSSLIGWNQFLQEPPVINVRVLRNHSFLPSAWLRDITGECGWLPVEHAFRTTFFLLVCVSVCFFLFFFLNHFFKVFRICSSQNKLYFTVFFFLAYLSLSFGITELGLYLPLSASEERRNGVKETHWPFGVGKWNLCDLSLFRSPSLSFSGLVPPSSSPFLSQSFSPVWRLSTEAFQGVPWGPEGKITTPGGRRAEEPTPIVSPITLLFRSTFKFTSIPDVAFVFLYIILHSSF